MSDLIDATVLVAYNDEFESFHQELTTHIQEGYPTVELLCYNTDILKERKKAFGVKGSYAAKVDPFAVVLDREGKPQKAFYSEVKECTVDNIATFLDSFLKHLNTSESENSGN